MTRLPISRRGTDDVLDVSDFALFDLNQLLASTSDVGADTVIDFGRGDSVTLFGVQKAELHDNDSIF